MLPFLQSPKELPLSRRGPLKVLMTAEAFSPENARVVTLSYRAHNFLMGSQTFLKSICGVPGVWVRSPSIEHLGKLEGFHPTSFV